MRLLTETVLRSVLYVWRELPLPTCWRFQPHTNPNLNFFGFCANALSVSFVYLDHRCRADARDRSPPKTEAETAQSQIDWIAC